MAQNPINFVETFALSKDRKEALQELVPGTEDFYYYHCLYHQLQGDLDAVDKLLETWTKRHGETERNEMISLRQLFLRYDQDPKGVLPTIIEKLDLDLDHQQELPNQRPDLPTKLDANSISWEAFESRARSSNSLGNFEDSGMEQLLREGKKLNPQERRDFLRRATVPDFPGLVDLIAADLNTPESRGFGEFPLHRALTLAQLDELSRKERKVLRDEDFIHAYLRKLQPNADRGGYENPSEVESYLEQALKFARPLEPSFNSLKAHLTHHLLVVKRDKGEYPRDLFFEYLKLPRQTFYIAREFQEKVRDNRHFAQLEADFRGVTNFFPIGDDSPLIRHFLLHYFRDDKDWNAFAPYLKESFLKPIFAEAKIVSGAKETEKWASMISPTEYQKLKNQVEIEFAPENKKRFTREDEVNLIADIKNVPSLLVKIYEINTLNFYLDHGKEINTDLNLDGLSANFERAMQFSESSELRVRREFDFPELKGKSGVFVIELIGNGRSSRALVRKGKLQHLAMNSAAGTQIVVLDEKNAEVKNAAVWLGGRKFTGDKNGVITIPFSTNPGDVPMILTDGKLASLESFEHAAETYDFTAKFHVERESLLPRKQAKVIVRPKFSVANAAAPLSLIENFVLTISSTDLDQKLATISVPNLKLTEDGELVHEFSVPDRLKSLDFTVTAEVKSVSTGKNVELSAKSSLSTNEILASREIDAPQLVATPEGFWVELRGRTGEALADRAMQIECKHRDFKNSHTVSLKTDEQGRIFLGKLEEIAWVKAITNGRASRPFELPAAKAVFPPALHGIEGEVVRMALPRMIESATRSDFALFEKRAGSNRIDHFDKLGIKDGMLVITGLEAGDYELHLKQIAGKRVTIPLAVSSAAPRLGFALGDFRHLELSNQQPLHLGTPGADEENVVIAVGFASKETRVHVVASRYLPENSLFEDLAWSLDGPSMIHRGNNTSRYVSGRDIGEEYRYILERRHGSRFPGNLLDRPSLLLNPWELSDTDTETQTAEAGSAYAASKPDSSRAKSRALSTPAPLRQLLPADQGHFATYDYFKNQAAVFTNLRPDQNGLVRIPRSELKDRQFLQIVAVDGDQTVSRPVILPEQKPEILDLRLREILDPKDYFVQVRKAARLQAGDTLQIADIRSTKLEIYDKLADVFQLYERELPELGKWRFLLDWPSLTLDRKKELYSEFACHELHFFLSRRDPEFFQTVVKPYLANKMSKMIVDKYLLGENLDHYRASFAFSRLNAFEKILLAKNLGGEKEAMLVRRLGEDFDLLPVDLAEEQGWFDDVMSGKSLETLQSLGGAIAGIRSENSAIAEDDGLLLEELAMEANGGSFDKRRNIAPPPARAALMAAPMAEGKNLSFSAQTKRLSESGGRIEAKKMLALRESSRQFYRAMESTKEWAESQYYQIPLDEQSPELVALNSFWLDFARWDGENAFLSEHFVRAAGDRTEALLALGLIDFAFEPAEHKVVNEENSLTLTAASPAIVYYRETKRAQISDDRSPILVSQNFFRDGERFRFEGNLQFDHFISEEFVSGQVYGCEIVVTNPSSITKSFEVLTQVPEGSIPVGQGKYTDSRAFRLEPYGTQKFEYFFYFPRAPKEDKLLAHFPVQVSIQEKVVAWVDPFVFKVVESPSQTDVESWEYVSQLAEPEKVIAYLESHNLQRLDLSKIAWRMRDRDFYEQVIALLDERFTMDESLLVYSFYHHDVPRMKSALQWDTEGDFLDIFGPAFESQLLVVDQEKALTYEHLDYSPLVNARAHQLGSKRSILNNRFYEQYHDFLGILAHQKTLSDQDRMKVVSYLFLQDRVEEALALLAEVNASELVTKIQHDYFQCYAAFYQDQPSRAFAIAGKYADFPVDRWRKRFADVVAQLKEISGDQSEFVNEDSRERVQEKLASTEPTFEFQIVGKSIALEHANLSEVRVNFYRMDLELLFSNSPFLSTSSEQFGVVRPTESTLVKLDAGSKQTEISLPDKFANENLMIEIVGPGRKRSATYFSNDLRVTTVESYGIVEVRKGSDGKVLPKTYVKVYARFQDGEVRFFKDGYTDLRGKFDYTSLNTDELDRVEKFSILVMSEGNGATVREVSPPQR